MNDRSQRPDLREQVGISVNASVLTMRQGVETALDRVAALGAASARIESGAARQGLPIAAMQPDVVRRSSDMRDLMIAPVAAGPDPRDIVAGELAPLLWHIRYGGQEAFIPRAVQLFAHWISHRYLFATLAGEAHRGLRENFSARVLHEWLSSRCPKCGGCGKEERSKNGQWAAPACLGYLPRNIARRACSICSGSGRALPRHAERMRIFGLTRDQYEEQGWPQRFRAALIWLTSAPQLLHRPLTSELERYKRRT